MSNANLVATFEKVSFEEFVRSAYYTTADQLLTADKEYYDQVHAKWENIKLPRRATNGSGGYDFYLPSSTNFIESFDTTIQTGIRVKLEPNWILAIFPRSGLGMKNGVRLKNTVGIIDSDYYNAENEGHIIIKMVTEEDFSLEEGDRFAQGILLPYGIATNDDVIAEERTGGMGSTGK